MDLAASKHSKSCARNPKSVRHRGALLVRLGGLREFSCGGLMASNFLNALQNLSEPSRPTEAQTPENEKKGWLNAAEATMAMPTACSLNVKPIQLKTFRSFEPRLLFKAQGIRGRTLPHTGHKASFSDAQDCMCFVRTNSKVSWGKCACGARGHPCIASHAVPRVPVLS